jgi:histone-lysine N-methyltransferase SETD2
MEEEERNIQRLKQRVRMAQEKQEQSILNQPDYPPLPQGLTPEQRFWVQVQEQQRIQAIITSAAEAKAAEEAAHAAELEERKAKEELAAANALKKKERAEKQRKHKPEDKAQKEANKEKRLLKLVGAVVVKSMSKYAKGLGKEDFKKHAKEVSSPLFYSVSKSGIDIST